MTADDVLRELLSLDAVEDGEVLRYDFSDTPSVRFDIPEGRIPPEVSQVLHVHDATLYEGCLTSGFREFKAHVPEP